MNRLWEKLSYLGDREGLSESQGRSLILSNRINFFVAFIFLIVCLVESNRFYLGERPFNAEYVRVWLLFGLGLANLLSNYLGYYKLTNVSVLFFLPSLLLVYPSITGVVQDEFFFWYPYVPIPLSLIPYFILNWRKDIRWLFVSVLYQFLLVVSIDHILLFFSTAPLEVTPIIQDNYFYYKFPAVTMFVFVNICIYYAFSMAHRYEKELVWSNGQLQEQSQQLEETNQLLHEQSLLLKKKNQDLKALNRTKDKLFRVIGHDLKNPLSTMISFMDLLESHIDFYDRKALLKIVSELKLSSMQGFSLLEELLDWARSQTGSMEFAPKLIDMADIVIENIKQQHGRLRIKGIGIENKISSALQCYADRHMINTILRNLLSNAVKFTPRGGLIYVDAYVDKDTIYCSVADNGIGISEEDIKYLFTSMHESSLGTDRESGTGLGLLLCYEFVRKHKGKIWAEARPTGGSIFWFSIPAFVHKPQA